MTKTATKGLTRAEEGVYEFIKVFLEEHDYPPSVRDICDGLHYSSVCTSSTHLRKLKKKNFITFQKGKGRTIELVDKEPKLKKYAKEIIKYLKEYNFISIDDVVVSLDRQSSNIYNGTDYQITIRIENEPHFEEVDDGVRC